MTFFAPRLPVILQTEAAECGAACLAMVLARHGRPITLEAARVACSTARDGVDADRLVAAAKSHGLEARGLRREPEALEDLPFPQILHWNFNHFVVLESCRRGRFVIHDPASGRRVLDRREFGQCFTGIVLVLEPGPAFRREGRVSSTMGLLFAEVVRAPDAVLGAALLGLAAIVPGLATTGAIAVFADHVIGQARLDWGIAVLGILLVAGVAQFMIAILNELIATALRAKIAAQVAAGGMWRALHLPICFFSQRSAGEIVSGLRRNSDRGQAVAGSLLRLVPEGIALLGYLAALAAFAPPIAAVIAAVALVNFLLMGRLATGISATNTALQVAEGVAAGALTTGIAALENYRLHGREMLLAERVAAAGEKALEQEQRIGLLRTIGTVAPQFSAMLMMAIVLCLGAWLVMQGQLTLGGLIACQVLVGLLNAPLAGMAGAMPHLHEAAGDFTHVRDRKNHPSARAVEPGELAANLPLTCRGRLRLEAIRFGFAPGSPLFQDVTLDFEPGRLVAIMGASGAGKSTLARIAAGLIEPWAGRVMLDGVPLEQWPQDELRRELAYVPQQAAVFSASIEENLTLRDMMVTPPDLAAALAQAGLEKLVAERSAGMKTRLSGHAPELSGGEVQRLALARALARKPRVLILDEATSALDFGTETGILDHLRRSGASVLIVTHRVGTAMRCDELVLIAGGGRIIRGQAKSTPAIDATPARRRA
jgi:ABC-type bacteriocin/lantibiotic exporter with double-glycine peptidase domain